MPQIDALVALCVGDSGNLIYHPFYHKFRQLCRLLRKNLKLLKNSNIFEIFIIINVKGYFSKGLVPVLLRALLYGTWWLDLGVR